jgi:vitellogenic carboxypeptidase-like protein
MYGLFAENGPIYVSEDGTELVIRNTSWANEYDIMFIDVSLHRTTWGVRILQYTVDCPPLARCSCSQNPVGTGFSFTNNPNGFVTDESEVGADLLQFLYTFYELYPERQSQPLFVCGESYAGKSVKHQ